MFRYNVYVPSNSNYFYNFAKTVIKDLVIEGVEDTSFECKNCVDSFSNQGSDSCHNCKENFYFEVLEVYFN